MKIENKSFWERKDIIATQEVLKRASDFEMFMFEKARERNLLIGKTDLIKVFGCGTGREIESIAEFFAPARIIASDISENMIARCKENLKLWKIDAFTETVVGNAKDYNEPADAFDLVTILNSMLTYVPKRIDRLKIFKNSLHILKPKATIVGTVHNQVGSPAKTWYFKLKSIFAFLLGDKVGNRNTGFNGFRVPGYYYTKKGLINDLEEAGFSSIEVYSLEEFYALKGTSYNKRKGYNNLIFIASKP
ncbi:MAG TPA: methyltransferase domain-containing protein [Flavobacterium sp.]|nr:methyltransferase domain-containing protein [Flavobacterium sp.]